MNKYTECLFDLADSISFSSKALQELSCCISSDEDRRDYKISSSLSQSLRSLQKALRSLQLKVDFHFTEEEIDLSISFHTFLRKGFDSPATSLLCNFIDSDIGFSVYQNFIKTISKNKTKGLSYLCKHHLECPESSSQEDWYMYYAIKILANEEGLNEAWEAWNEQD